MNANGFNVIVRIIPPNLFQDFAGRNRLTMTLEKTM